MADREIVYRLAIDDHLSLTILLSLISAAIEEFAFFSTPVATGFADRHMRHDSQLHRIQFQAHLDARIFWIILLTPPKYFHELIDFEKALFDLSAQVMVRYRKMARRSSEPVIARYL